MSGTIAFIIIVSAICLFGVLAFFLLSKIQVED